MFVFVNPCVPDTSVACQRGSIHLKNQWPQMIGSGWEEAAYYHVYICMVWRFKVSLY